MPPVLLVIKGCLAQKEQQVQTANMELRDPRVHQEVWDHLAKADYRDQRAIQVNSATKASQVHRAPLGIEDHTENLVVQESLGLLASKGRMALMDLSVSAGHQVHKAMLVVPAHQANLVHEAQMVLLAILEMMALLVVRDHQGRMAKMECPALQVSPCPGLRDLLDHLVHRVPRHQVSIWERSKVI